MTGPPPETKAQTPIIPAEAAGLELSTATLDAWFPIRRQLDFFNHAGVAPLSAPAADALCRYAAAATHGFAESDLYTDVLELRRLAARLIHARGPHEIAFIPNTSTGIAMVARGLRFAPGDRVVIHAGDYPANRYPWDDLARRGVEVVAVPSHPDGRIEIDDVCRRINDRTRVVAISHVQYATGYRIDLRAIADEAHAAGAYLCVDAIQSCGVCPVDVRAMGIDFLAADGHKWMLGPEGAGIFYCREDLCELLHPAIVGWMNMKDPLNFGGNRFALQPDARRFEPGSWNVPGLLALRASLELLLGVGVERVWSRVKALSDHLVAGLRERGVHVASPRRAEAECSGVVSFAPQDGAVSAEKTIRRLRERGVVAAARGGRVRVSPHFYNDRAQIERLLAALDELHA